MQDFRKRPGGRVGWQKMLMGCGAILALAALAFFSVRAAYGMYEKFTVAAAADDQAQAQYADLEQQYAQVKTDVQEVSTPEGVEGQIRERWGLAKPGEGEIDIVEQAASSSPAAAQPQGFFASLWQTLFVW